MPDPRIVWRLSATDGVSKTLGVIDSRLGRLGKTFKTLGQITVGVATVRGLQQIATAALQFGDRLDDLSKRTGITATALQELEYAAGQSGATLDAFVGAMTRLARANDDAVQGVSGAAEAFRRLGIDAQDLASLPLDERMYRIADALAGVADVGERTALATKVLGRGAGELLPLFAQGAAGIRKFAEELRATNTVLSDEQVKALGDANDAIERLLTSFKNLGRIALAEVAPALTAIADTLTKGIAVAADRAAPALNRVAEAWRALNEQRLFVGNRGLEIVEDVPKGPQGRRTAVDPVRDYIRRAQEAQALNITVPEPNVTDAIEAWDKLAEASKRAAETAQADIARIIEQTRTPLEQYRVDLARVDELMRSGLSAEVAAREIQRLGQVLGEQTQAMTDATDAGREWAEAQARAAEILAGIEAPIDRAARKYRELADLQSKGLLSPEEVAKAQAQTIDDLVGKVESAAVTVDDKTRGILEDIRNATEGVARDITDIFFDTTKSIGDMFADVFERIARLAVERTIVQPFVDLISGALGGLFGGGGLDLIDMSSLPKRRAAGGPVTAGQPYLVGEEGPELFMPRQSGQIVPNGATVGQPAINLTVNVTSVDPNGAAAVVMSQERLILNMIRRAQSRAGYGATV